MVTISWFCCIQFRSLFISVYYSDKVCMKTLGSVYDFLSGFTGNLQERTHAESFCHTWKCEFCFVLSLGKSLMKIHFMMIFVYAFKTLTKFYFNRIRSWPFFFSFLFLNAVLFFWDPSDRDHQEWNEQAEYSWVYNM